LRRRKGGVRESDMASATPQLAREIKSSADTPAYARDQITVPVRSCRVPVLFHAARFALATAFATLALTTAASAQTAGTRQSMERCVDGVLARMARAKAPEAQVGQAVVAQCDAPLRAALASAIETGEAFICTVDSCIGMARQRAAEEAKSAYRERLTRGL
jgi:hypothetical protein